MGSKAACSCMHRVTVSFTRHSVLINDVNLVNIRSKGCLSIRKLLLKGFDSLLQIFCSHQIVSLFSAGILFTSECDFSNSVQS